MLNPASFVAQNHVGKANGGHGFHDGNDSRTKADVVPSFDFDFAFRSVYVDGFLRKKNAWNRFDRCTKNDVVAP
jgi:hypothetical protein